MAITASSMVVKDSPFRAGTSGVMVGDMTVWLRFLWKKEVWRNAKSDLEGRCIGDDLS